MQSRHVMAGKILAGKSMAGKTHSLLMVSPTFQKAGWIACSPGMPKGPAQTIARIFRFGIHSPVERPLGTPFRSKQRRAIALGRNWWLGIGLPLTGLKTQGQPAQARARPGRGARLRQAGRGHDDCPQQLSIRRTVKRSKNQKRH